MGIIFVLALLRIYAIAQEDELRERGFSRHVFGETDEAAVYQQAYLLAMNATGLTPADLSDADNVSRFRTSLHEYRALLLDAAAHVWLSAVPVKLATYTTTGLIILLHVGQDIVNGVRLLICAARLAMVAHLEAARCVRDVRLAVVGQNAHNVAQLRQTAQPDRYGRFCEVGKPSRPSWLLAVFLMMTAWCQVFVGLLVVELCSLAVQTESNLKEIFLNFIALTFIVSLDDLLLKCPFFRPNRQRLLVRPDVGVHMRMRGTDAEPMVLDLDGDFTIRLEWVGELFTPEPAPKSLRWLLGRRVHTLLGYPLKAHDGLTDAREDADMSALNPHVQLPVTDDYRGPRATLLAVLVLLHHIFLFSFSNFGRIDKVLAVAPDAMPQEVLRLFRIVAHSLLGFLIATLYVERVGLASSVRWLIAQLLLVAVLAECVPWGLAMAGTFLPAGLLPADLTATLTELVRTSLHSFFTTLLLAFCLGHRSAGEVEVEISGRFWAADSSPIGSVVMLCLLVSHFNFQLLPTGSLHLAFHSFVEVALQSLSALLTARGQYYFGSVGSAEGHAANEVIVVACVAAGMAGATYFAWSCGVRLRETLLHPPARRRWTFVHDRGFSFWISFALLAGLLFVVSLLHIASAWDTTAISPLLVLVFGLAFTCGVVIGEEVTPADMSDEDPFDLHGVRPMLVPTRGQTLRSLASLDGIGQSYVDSAWACCEMSHYQAPHAAGASSREAEAAHAATAALAAAAQAVDAAQWVLAQTRPAADGSAHCRASPGSTERGTLARTAPAGCEAAAGGALSSSRKPPSARREACRVPRLSPPPHLCAAPSHRQAAARQLARALEATKERMDALRAELRSAQELARMMC